MSVPQSDAPQPRWRQLCEQALFEVDENKIMQRVMEAQKEINKTRQQVVVQGSIQPQDEILLRKAESALNCLRSVYERRCRDRNTSINVPLQRGA